MAKRSTTVGLDVHKDTIDVVIAEPEADGEVRHFGTIGGDLGSVDRMLKRLRRPGRRLQFVYEAGPCGFQLYRHLTGQGVECAVVAPSMTPRRSGDRVKTDRRDAEALARLHRAGELRAIYVPTPEDEAIRDLVRAREDAVEIQRRARQRLKAFVLRHGFRYAGRAGWTFRYRHWLAGLRFPHPAQQLAFQEYIDTIGEAEKRVARLTEEITKALEGWCRAPVVRALQALRGVSLLTAATLVAELGDIARFATPCELMAYLGLVPSEYSSGAKTRRGAITKAGNPHVRRVLAEAAWAYQGQARVGRAMMCRQEKLPQAIRDIGWKAQLRLTTRFRRLAARGKARPKVATAIARELTGFISDIARHVPLTSQLAAGGIPRVVPVAARGSAGL